jgi:hypothetical protein
MQIQIDGINPYKFKMWTFSKSSFIIVILLYNINIFN